MAREARVSKSTVQRIWECNDIKPYFSPRSLRPGSQGQRAGHPAAPPLIVQPPPISWKQKSSTEPPSVKMVSVGPL